MILDILNELASTDSINEKQAILEREQGNDLLRRVFLLAYSKRFNYGIKKWPEPGETSQAFGMVNLEDLLDFAEYTLAPRIITGNAAIKSLSDFIADSNKNDTEVLRRVMMRDLECGAGTTLPNRVWKGLIPEQPQMLASPYDEAKILKDIKFPAYAQLKADGARCFAEITDDGVKFFSRNGNEYQGLELLADQLFEMTKEARERHPAGVMIDGELVYHETVVEQVNHDLFSMFEDEPEELSKAKEFQANVNRTTSNGLANKALKGTLTNEEAVGMKFQVWDYVPLDVVYSEGQKAGFAYDVRFRALELMVEGFSQIILIENQIVHNLAEAKAVYKKYIAMKLEGIILKNINGFWENKRSKNQYKFKEVIDVALEIFDYYEHEKDPNKIGGIWLKSSCGKIVTRCGSGFKDTTRIKDKKTKKWVDIPIEDRHELDREALMVAAKAGKLVGRIIDGECNGWLTSETRKENTVSLFLPIIVGFRFDKDKADTFEELFGDWSQTGLE